MEYLWVRRLYVQDGVVHNNSLADNGRYNSVTDGYCDWIGMNLLLQNNIII
jgi:hypothetical protein